MASEERIRERLAVRRAAIPEDLQPGEVPPSDAAWAACEEILREFAADPRRPQPLPLMSTIGTGGLECSWPMDERSHVVLNITKDGTAYLHTIERLRP